MEMGMGWDGMRWEGGQGRAGQGGREGGRAGEDLDQQIETNLLQNGRIGLNT